MKKLLNISSAELEVMQVLWKADSPLKIQEVCDRLQSSKWKYNTIGTLLSRLVEKGAVKAEKIDRANYFTPILEEEVYKKSQTKNLISKLYHGSVKELAVSLFQSEEMTEEDIEEIRQMFTCKGEDL